jgi:hypothetical protein
MGGTFVGNVEFESGRFANDGIVFEVERERFKLCESGTTGQRCRGCG